MYRLALHDSTDDMHFDVLQIPITDNDVEGASDNTTLDGNVYTDFLYLKKVWKQSWKQMDNATYQRLRGFYTRQFSTGVYPELTMTDLLTNTALVTSQAVRMKLTDGGVINECGCRRNVTIELRQSTND